MLKGYKPKSVPRGSGSRLTSACAFPAAITEQSPLVQDSQDKPATSVEELPYVAQADH